jgi:hypothetical protein
VVAPWPIVPPLSDARTGSAEADCADVGPAGVDDLQDRGLACATVAVATEVAERATTVVELR